MFMASKKRINKGKSSLGFPHHEELKILNLNHTLYQKNGGLSSPARNGNIFGLVYDRVEEPALA